MTATEVLIYAISAALDNAGDMRIRTEDRQAYAFGTVLGDVFCGSLDSYPQSGYLSEVYDNSADPPVRVLYSCGQLRAPLSELWKGWLQVIAESDLETYLRKAAAAERGRTGARGKRGL